MTLLSSALILALPGHMCQQCMAWSLRASLAGAWHHVTPPDATCPAKERVGGRTP